MINFASLFRSICVCACLLPVMLPADVPWKTDAEPVAPPPGASNLWFEVGETLTYDITWGIFTVGKSLVTTQWVKHEDGRVLLAIRFETRTNGIVEKLYPVEDYNETLIDIESFLPVRNLRQSRQGRRQQHEVVKFDHRAGKAYFESILKNKKKEIDIQPDTRDIISLMYFIRSKAFKVGTEEQMKVFTDEKVYDLFLKIARKDKVNLDKYGDVASLRFDPEAAFDGLFVRKGKMLIWVSDDARKLCTKIAAEVPVAKIRITLAEVSGPGQDFWVGKSLAGSPEATVVPRH